MALQITCDRCGAEVVGDFVLVQSDFYTLDGFKLIEFCTQGDEMYMCPRCYDEIMKELG